AGGPGPGSLDRDELRRLLDEFGDQAVGQLVDRAAGLTALGPDDDLDELDDDDLLDALDDACFAEATVEVMVDHPGGTRSHTGRVIEVDRTSGSALFRAEPGDRIVGFDAYDVLSLRRLDRR
ncbi:MAG: hypothetical protein H0W25_20345, partial [Acidimicrobiia bacterium]|nr:hypothetical protein [Acidimicrobiia bacterium]